MVGGIVKKSGLVQVGSHSKAVNLPTDGNRFIFWKNYPPVRAVNPYRKEAEDFITSLKSGTSVGTSIEEACRSVRVLEPITESYISGRAEFAVALQIGFLSPSRCHSLPVS